MSALSVYVDRRVLVVTADGRTILGLLKGFDQTTNVILSESVERIFSADEPTQDAPLGLYVIRGDNIALVGEIDAGKEDATDWPRVQVEPIDEVRH